MKVGFSPNLVCTCGIPTSLLLPVVMVFTQIMNMLLDWGPSHTSVTAELHWGKKREEILCIMLADKTMSLTKSLTRELSYCWLQQGSAKWCCFGELSDWFSSTALTSWHVCVSLLVYEAPELPVVIRGTHQAVAVCAFFFLFTDSWRLVIKIKHCCAFTFL